MFSIIIPAYNAEHYIVEAINSSLAQGGIEFEVIVVNDGSKDNTLDIIKEYGQQIIIVDQENLGISCARNNGVNVSSGDYIAFLDSDDVWLPDKLKKQAQKIKEGFDVCYTNRYNFGKIGDLPYIQTDICNMPEGFIIRDLILGNMITTSSVVIKKEIFEELGGFDESLSHCEDWDLWLKCALKYPIGVDLVPLIKYRIHGQGLSSNHLKMAYAREVIVRRVLALDHCEIFNKEFRSKIISSCYSSSAWEAGKAKDFKKSLFFYFKAIEASPYDSAIWYNLARLVTGRI